jgi:protein TonB
MLSVLLESRAPRTRRIGGTVTSTVVHAGVIAAAIAITVPQPGRANDGPSDMPPPIYIAMPERPAPVAHAAPRPRSETQAPLPAPLPGPVLQFNGPDVPVIRDIVPTRIATTPQEFGSGLPAGGTIGAPPGLGAPAGGVIEERFVDRSPRLLGSPMPPTFPQALRQLGRAGRVLVQFVVDTTGRAEMDGFKVMEATDAQFAESVRAALPRYRFSPGEAAGRKVRTLVQLPFDFTLVR